jgi:hypothetical protein
MKEPTIPTCFGTIDRIFLSDIISYAVLRSHGHPQIFVTIYIFFRFPAVLICPLFSLVKFSWIPRLNVDSPVYLWSLIGSYCSDMKQKHKSWGEIHNVKSNLEKSFDLWVDHTTGSYHEFSKKKQNSPRHVDQSLASLSNKKLMKNKMK